jgi:hypothetical protein
MPIRILTVVLSRGGVSLRLFVIAVIVMMGSLAVVVCRCRIVRGGIVMMLAGRVLLFLYHREFPL